jgi:ubiquitin-protein ligase E3 A
MDDLVLDVQSIRRAFTKLFAIPDLPFQSTLISAVHYLSRTLAADLRSRNIFSKYPEYPNVFIIIMEIPALSSLEFLEEAMPQFCKTVGLLPVQVQVHLARFWSKFEADQLRILVNRVQQLITVRVIPHHETGTPSALVHDDDCITGAACLLKILYFASIVGGAMDPQDLIVSEKADAKLWADSVGFQDLLPADSYVGSNPSLSRERKDKPTVLWEDPLALELGVNPIDCREPLVNAEDFVNEMLSDTVEIDKDYTYYRAATVAMSGVMGSASFGAKFSYMLHPYLLTTAVKSTGMFFDNRIRMISERRASVLQNIVHGGNAGGAPYLRLRIRRDHIVDDALINVCIVRNDVH